MLVTALFKKELDIEVETVGGKTGELTVWGGDQLIARKRWIRFPGDQTALQAVKAALKS
jgi:hypothetical protein